MLFAEVCLFIYCVLPVSRVENHQSCAINLGLPSGRVLNAVGRTLPPFQSLPIMAGWPKHHPPPTHHTHLVALLQAILLGRSSWNGPHNVGEETAIGSCFSADDAHSKATCCGSRQCQI